MVVIGFYEAATQGFSKQCRDGSANSRKNYSFHRTIIGRMLEYPSKTPKKNLGEHKIQATKESFSLIFLGAENEKIMASTSN